MTTNKHDNEYNIGNILEVNLEYPIELHDLHDENRLVPEKLFCKENMLNNYCQMLKKN